MAKFFPLLFPLSFFGLLLVERFLPGRPQPQVRGWVAKAIVFFFMGGVINFTVPPLVAKAMAGHALVHLAGLPLAAAVLATLLAVTFVTYWGHRMVHRVTWIWRWTHQMHHSAERVDLAGFAYAHPLDLALQFAFASLPVALLGVSPQAAMISGYVGFLLGLFEHLNLRTPRWLGYVVQRPESHGVHHQRGVHAYNYGLPIWDMAFGTFRNPAQWSAQAGFWDGASRRVGDMLLGRDVSEA
jgi:sterol desaturase/sphingolipid hydroxylase (fatty acid hydroxylase superfamily)